MLLRLALAALTATLAAAATERDPWGEDAQPRIRVNYLTQRSGKKEISISFLSSSPSSILHKHSLVLLATPAEALQMQIRPS